MADDKSVSGDLLAPASDAPPPSRRELFLGFLIVGMQGFGGVLPFARRMLVEQRRWVSEREFIEVLSLSQFLPGPNIVNVSIIVGSRFRGASGSVAAVLGLMLMPFLIVLALAALYAQFAAIEAVRGATNGVSAAATGLVIATAIKMAQPLKGVAWQIAMGVLTFVAIGLLSFLAIGGVNALIPEIHRRVVENTHWLTDADFAQAFAIAQAAPGPNLLIVSLIGWKVDGFLGALVCTVAICAPSSALTFAVAHVWDRFRDAPLRKAIQYGLAPVTVGLVLASGFILARTVDNSAVAVGLTAATVVLALATRLHPLWMLAAGAAVGAFVAV